MLRFFLYFLTLSEDVRSGLIFFFIVNRLIASAVSALMAARRGRVPWKWALTSLILGWVGFIVVCVSKNLKDGDEDKLGGETLIASIFLGIVITWAVWNYVESIKLMPWIDTVEEVKDLFRGEYKPEKEKERTDETWDFYLKPETRKEERKPETRKEERKPEPDYEFENYLRDIKEWHDEFVRENPETESPFPPPSIRDREGNA